MTLKYQPLVKKINDIVLAYEHGQINLVFQDKSRAVQILICS